MKKLFAIIAMFCAVSMSASAQDKTTSINIGFAPFGYIHENIVLKDEKYKYDYKSYYNISFGIEKQFKGATTLSEFKYAAAAFDHSELTGSSQWFDPTRTEDIFAASFTQYIGKTINPNKRIQFPLYLGVGGSYLKGGPFHNLTIDGAVKARVKFFITNHIGIFAGGTARYGWGAKHASEKEQKNGDMYSINSTSWSVDAGLTIGF